MTMREQVNSLICNEIKIRKISTWLLLRRTAQQDLNATLPSQDVGLVIDIDRTKISLCVQGSCHLTLSLF